MGKKRVRKISRERTPHRNKVRFYALGPLLSLTCITIDRDHDRATVFTAGLTLPSWHLVKPLSLIMGVQLSKRDRGEKEPLYGIVVRRNKGGRIHFACRSREIAMETLRLLNSHLQVETRSSGRTEPDSVVQENEKPAPLLDRSSALSA